MIPEIDQAPSVLRAGEGWGGNYADHWKASVGWGREWTVGGERKQGIESNLSLPSVLKQHLLMLLLLL